MLVVNNFFPKKAPESVPVDFSWNALWEKFVKGEKFKSTTPDIIKQYKKELEERKR